jgi:uroporphyrinogen decarboxylase
MTSRERVFTAIAHREPDRPPIFATLTPQAAKALSRHLHLPYEPPLDSLLSTRISHMGLLTLLGNDCVGIAACAPHYRPSYTRPDGSIVNEWGMRFKNTGIYKEFCAYPLHYAEVEEDVLSYDFPDPHAPGRFLEAQRTIDRYAETHAVVADVETAIFETSWYLVGLEKMLTDLMLRPSYLSVLLDRVMEINLETARILIRMGADILWAGDDFGMQQGMVMDPGTWREVFKPRIRVLFEEYRKINPDIRIAWHSCGSIWPIIPDFIEIGLDILNPIQPKARDMDPVRLKQEFGRDLVFFGGIDVQELLPHGSPQEVKDEVKRRIEILGKNGGYIVAPAHNIQPDTPVQNVLAMFEAVREFPAGH